MHIVEFRVVFPFALYICIHVLCTCTLHCLQDIVLLSFVQTSFFLSLLSLSFPFYDSFFHNEHLMHSMCEAEDAIPAHF